jgi:hypothetical protein
MPRPTSDTLIQRPDLGMLVEEYMDQAPTMGYIGLDVMPIKTVQKQSATYPVLPKEALLKIPDTSRTPRGAYNRSDYEFENGFYATQENGWEEAIDDTERKLYASMFDAEAVATRRAVKIILGSQEKRISAMVFNASNFTPNAVTTEWDTAATATPVADVNAGKLSVRSACGMLPNTLIISYTTFVNLRSCDEITELIKYTFPGIDINRMTRQQLAAVFDIPQVLVGGAIYDSAKKGQAASITDLWSYEYAMLTVASASEDILEPCIGRTFLWTEDSAENTIVESYRDEARRSDIVRVRHNTQERLLKSYDSSDTAKSDIAAACSYLLSNIHT